MQPKRPYNFRLASGTSLPLFGMGMGRHWTLLANYMDYSLVRNTIGLNLARELGISHTPMVRSVDVFINGIYKGVYDLTERRSLNHSVHLTDLEAATQAVNNVPLSSFPARGVFEPFPGTFKYISIPYNPLDITGGYLLEIQFPHRYMSANSGFVTTRGTVVNLRAPNYASQAQVLYIYNFFQSMENAIYSSSGFNTLGRHFTEYLCIRSFAIKYIFEEFMMDVDAVHSSFFMYKESNYVGTGRLYPGPAWDFDFSLGVLRRPYGVYLQNPQAWWVNRGSIISNDLGMERVVSEENKNPHILNALYQHNIFQKYVHLLWQEEAAPAIRILLGIIENEERNLRSIYEYMNIISASRVMNHIIWPLPANRRFSNPVTDITNFAIERFHFLDSAWGIN